MIGKKTVFGLLLVLNVLVVYSNHFNNDFQFDDINAVPDNPAIRDHRTVVKAFVDPNLFSAMPEQRNYRPVTTASLALDYWLAGGLNVFFFHLSTFFWFSVQLVLMFLLFERMMNLADPHPSNFWTALAAAAVFGLHPVCAETVNYIIQRADLYNALGCIAALWLYAAYPSQRKFGWYLLPAALAMLAKAPALVFPLLLASYVCLFELPEVPAGLKWKRAATAILPSLGLTAAAAWLLAWMQPATWNAGHVSPAAYRLTQPFVALHYFATFFVPAGLSVDHGWHYLNPLGMQALAGYLFVLGLLAAAVLAARRRVTRPVAFGIFWFFFALLPTSLMALGDVTNDHRMFFAFVGLAPAVLWSLRLALFRQTARFTRQPYWTRASVAVLVVLLVVAGVATRARNRTWLTAESLWLDAIAKEPHNTRALNNYGAVGYAQGDYQKALTYWQRAAELDPTCVSCQANLVRASMKLRRDDLVEHSFQTILRIGPRESEGYVAYAEWLTTSGRFEEAARELDRAEGLAPQSKYVRCARRGLMRARDAADRSVIFRALDTDHDNRLSLRELLAAPLALLALDKNGDGRLTPDEYGDNRGDWQAHPLLHLLDTDHDGVISAAEIRDAGRRLSALPRDAEGDLSPGQTVPQYVRDTASRMVARLDSNHHGRIDTNQMDRNARGALAGLLSAADADGDGVLTVDDLVDEIFYRADRNKDGTVTRNEMDAAISGGLMTPMRAGEHGELPGKSAHDK